MFARFSIQCKLDTIYPLARSFSHSRILKNHYNALNVKQSASRAEIKTQYYKLAKAFHPDSNKDPSAKERFLLIQTAYDTLKDDFKRSQYDQSLVSSQPLHNYNYTPWRRKPNGNVNFGFEAHQYGHYGSPGSKAREERMAAAARFAREQTEMQRERYSRTATAFFIFASIYVMFLSKWAWLIFV